LTWIVSQSFRHCPGDDFPVLVTGIGITLPGNRYKGRLDKLT
jgi:hypothetical protein